MLTRLREHRTRPAGLSDLLIWGFLVDPGVILQKDGSLLAGFRYAGPDATAATTHELDAVSHHVNDALLPFADDWMFHVDAVRRPAVAYPAGHFPDPVSQAIDDERRSAYAAHASRQFETTYALVATYLPPPELVSRFVQWFVQGASQLTIDWERVLAQFTVALHSLERRLSGHLALERLSSDALVTHLHECLTGRAHPVRAPHHGAYLNIVLGSQDLLGGFGPKIGDRAIRAVAIQGFPHASHAGALDMLNALPFAYRWSTRLVPLSQTVAARLIRRQQLTWFKKRKGATAWLADMVGGGKRAAPTSDDDLFLDHDAKAMAADAASAVAANASGAVRFCFTTQVLVVTDPDPAHADLVAQELVKALADRGFPSRIETVNALEAYLGSLPGHGYPNLRRPLFTTQNLADLLPVTSVWPGLATNPCSYYPTGSPPLLWAATGGATPFRVNLHDSDVGHALVLGPTGAGKSVLLGTLAAQFLRYPRAQVFVFDVGYSMWTLAHAVGGSHYDLAAGTPDSLKFQPLCDIDRAGDRAWAADWIETLAALQGVDITPAHRARIDRALALISENYHVHRTLSELAAHLQDADLVAALRPYTLLGNYGDLLDATQDDLATSRFTVFEMKHLLELDDKIAVPVLLYLFHRVERRLDGSPTLIEIDEAWMALLHERFGPRITQWLLTLRKQNAAVVLATQSPAQLAALANRHTVVNSCPTKFYLPNADAAAPGTAALYRDFGLNAREIETIAGATPKRHYYQKTPRGSRLFELALGPVARAFLTTPPGATMEEGRAQVTALMAVHGPSWPEAWLTARGLSPWAETVRAWQIAHAPPRDGDPAEAREAAAPPARSLEAHPAHSEPPSLSGVPS